MKQHSGPDYHETGIKLPLTEIVRRYMSRSSGEETFAGTSIDPTTQFTIRWGHEPNCLNIWVEMTHSNTTESVTPDWWLMLSNQAGLMNYFFHGFQVVEEAEGWKGLLTQTLLASLSMQQLTHALDRIIKVVYVPGLARQTKKQLEREASLAAYPSVGPCN